MSVLISCILSSILIAFCKASFNANPTASVLGLQNVKGTTIQISEDDGMIAVGFADGTLKLFDTSVNQICSSVSTMGQQILQIVWMPNFGPVSVDVAYKVTLWSTDCNQSSQMSFNQSISRIAYTESTDQASGNVSGIIGLNFEDSIQEYNIQNFTAGRSYNPADNDIFVDFVYYSDETDTFLIASTTGAKVLVFNTSDGEQIDSFDVQSVIQRMDVIGDKIIGYGQNNNIYRFSTIGDLYSLGWFTPATSISVCSSTLQFALSQLSSPGIQVYLYARKKDKSLTGLNGIVKQVDCSKSYLVSIDDKGYINVYTYQIFKKWIIGMIIGIAVGLLVLIVGVIVCMRLRKKWAEEADQQKYRTNKPKKYPRNNLSPSKTESMKMLQNITLQTLSK